MSVDMQPSYVLASGASRAMEQLDIQANNLANVSTPGFKKLLMTEMSQAVPDAKRGEEDLFVFSRFSESRVMLQQGGLIETDSKNDMALSGDGFFEVRRGGETVLTRQGKMRLDIKGFLLDDHGGNFIDAKGKPIRLDTVLPFTVSNDGSILQDGIAKAKLSIKSYESVAPAGAHYYRPDGDQVKTDVTVRQGFLEDSNLNATEAMVSLIESQRRFEIYGNLIRSLDQLEQKANEIGRA